MKNFEDIYEFVDSEDEEFRNSLATVDKTGKRIWLYPKKVSGAFFNKRVIATIIFLIVFIAGPFIKINGMPLLMMNVFERKFSIFGQLFMPQDFICGIYHIVYRNLWSHMVWMALSTNRIYGNDIQTY